MSRVVVIGAGVAGLASAGLLAREGHEVLVLEKNERVGGRAGVIEDRGFRFDTGPSWYLMPEVFDHFFELMGTSTAEQLSLQTLDPGYAVFAEPQGRKPAERVVVPHGRGAASALFESLEPGAGRALNRYLDEAQRASELANKYFLYNSFEDFRSLLTREVLGAAPSLARLLGTSLAKHVERRFEHPVLRQILGYPAVFLATRPEAAPAIYHLMSSLDLEQGVQYPRGGFWRLVERIAALAEDAGAQVVTGAKVISIDTEGSGSEGRSRVRAVRWTDAEGLAHECRADVVVSAADLHHTETRLLQAKDRTYPEAWWRRRTSGPGAVLAMLGVEGEIPQLGHHSLFFTRDWEKNFDAIFSRNPHVPHPASAYVCKPSATDPEVAPEGHENLFVLVPVPADVGLGAGGKDGSGSPDVELVTDRAIEQIAAWAQVPELAKRVVVRHTIGPADFARDYNSWRGGVLGPAHVLSQSAMFRAGNESKKVEGLFYAGATTSPGVGVPMCLISAEIVLKRLRGDTSAGPLPHDALAAAGPASTFPAELLRAEQAVS